MKIHRPPPIHLRRDSAPLARPRGTGTLLGCGRRRPTPGSGHRQAAVRHHLAESTKISAGTLRSHDPPSGSSSYTHSHTRRCHTQDTRHSHVYGHRRGDGARVATDRHLVQHVTAHRRDAARGQKKTSAISQIRYVKNEPQNGLKTGHLLS